jgi:5-formyltetrahydrofolate cyclo-ligase
MKKTKAELRREIRTRLKELKPASASTDAARLVAQVTTLAEWKAAQSVFLFVPMSGEPAVDVLLELALAAGKRVVVPAYEAETDSYLAREVKVSTEDLVTGKFGVLEPHRRCAEVPVGALDFAVVPGVAFTPDGKRLGRGRGFYDRMLASFRAVSCGVGLDEQIVADMPVEPHDVKLSYVVTPTRLWDCRAKPT